MAARFLPVPAWRSRPPLLSIGGDPFVLRARVRAAVSRLAGIADWTTQPRRDAANYPSGSPAPTERVGFPEETDYTRYTRRLAPPRSPSPPQFSTHLPANLVNGPPPLFFLFSLFPLLGGNTLLLQWIELIPRLFQDFGLEFELEDFPPR